MHSGHNLYGRHLPYIPIHSPGQHAHPTPTSSPAACPFQPPQPVTDCAVSVLPNSDFMLKISPLSLWISTKS